MTNQVIKGSSSHLSFRKKIVPDYKLLSRIIEGLRAADYKIVATIGSWDMLHIGHLRYLMEAKSKGDILVVGTDTDAAIKSYKGPNRPIIPEHERMEMLSYQACVDFVTKIPDVDNKGNWNYGLIKALEPDVFVAVEDSYPPHQRKEIKKHCGELVILPRQAENTSSSSIIQNTFKKNITAMMEMLEKRS